MDATSKKNCWEIFDCHREVSREKRDDSVCPVTVTSYLNGVNSGENAGRACWKIMGTFCTPAEHRGSFLYKEIHCKDCSFRHQVEQEEGAAFIP